MKEEVTWALKKLKPHKSPGTDGITAELLQVGGDIVGDELDKIINDIWEHERMPGVWNKSIIVTLPKKGDLKICTNYRTISLINHACKVLLYY